MPWRPPKPTTAPPDKPPGSLAPAPRGWPIKVSIASVVVVAMALVAGIVITLGWVNARQRMMDTAAQSAQDASLLIQEKSRRMLEPGQVALRVLSTTPIVSAKTLDERVRHLRTLADVLITNGVLASVYVGYGDGSFFLVRPLLLPALRERFQPPEQAEFMAQSVQTGPKGSVGHFLFFDAKYRLLEKRLQPGYAFDPRTRPWYQSATRSANDVFTEPYVFFTTQQVGLTLSRTSAQAGTVLGIDVVLDELAANLAGLRTTPNAQMALLNHKGEVLAYPDMARVLVKRDGRFEFKTIDAIGAPGLAALEAHPERIDKTGKTSKTLTYEVNGTEWLGTSLAFRAFEAEGVHLLLATPADDFLGDLKARARQTVLVVVLTACLLLPLGWVAGAAIGKNLDGLTERAQRLQRFDFHAEPIAPTLVREVNNLSQVLDDMRDTVQTFLKISHDMSTESHVELMLAQVLQQMVSATRCTGGAVYLADTATGSAVNAMQQAARTGVLAEHDAPLWCYAASGSSHWRREVAPGLSELQVELRGRRKQLEGVLVLQHATDFGHADLSFTEFVRKLSGMLAVSIETRQLMDAQKELLDSIIRLMADAIDAKSPYTGGHCERVPELAGMLIDHLAEETQGPYASFGMTEDERYEFHLGAWLHDCGKVTSPEHIIDKATKLETIYNRIHEVRMRFEVLWRDAELAFWQGLAEGGDRALLQTTLDQCRAQLQDDYTFVARCNVGGETMATGDMVRLQALAQTSWTRHFDNRIGLSAQELMRIHTTAPQARPLPVQEQLLADRPDHIVPWGTRKPPVDKNDPKNRFGFDMALPQHEQHLGELYNLLVRRGTLTEEDRFKINDHIVQTLIMLRSLPWPAHLARVPDIAATHHEKLNGQGYPRKLNAAQLSLPDRVMALADIFEALTAADRPYKAPKTLSESLRIMATMAQDHHLDPALFRYFLHSRVWEAFADKYMQSAQRDEVDVAAIEALLPGVFPAG
ncbi:MAG: metal-dependent phosphohydrolase [Burkholderiales bacterium PBB3]|nr:MAG: metal-dependent phosphohydrolase [Burkholderiales bacterium PBB3]